MNSEEMMYKLINILYHDHEIKNIRTFENVMILTTGDGSEFQITVVQSK